MTIYNVDTDKEFRAAKNSAPDWSTINLEAGATFSSMFIDNDKLRIVGDATVIGGVTITADYITLRDMTIIGGNRSAVSISKSRDINLNWLHLKDSDKYGVYAYQSDRIIVQNSDIHGNSVGGISIHVPAFQGKTGFIHIHDNDIFDNGREWLKEKWSIIADYDFWRRDLPEYHPPFTIKNNTIHENGSALLAFHANNMRVIDNDFIFNNLDRPGRAELRLLDSTHNTVSGNNFWIDSDHRAMSFEEGSTAKVSDTHTVYGTLADAHHEGGSLHDDHWIF
jgi:hypothetical protein